MKIKNILIASSFMLMPMASQALDVGIGVKTGTAGAGFDLSLAVTNTINVRFSSTSFDVPSSNETLDIRSSDGSTDVATIDATATANFGATAVLLDWYVFDGTFHLTGGMMKSNTNFNLDGVFTGSNITFGGRTYNISNDLQDNTATADVSFGDDFKPYVGIGWGRKASDEPGLSLSVELGVFILDPSVTLKAPQLKINTPGTTKIYTQADQDQLDADVKSAETSANTDIANLTMWPVLSVGLNYAF